jgi:predicted TIM-barrel enzyme
MKKFTRKEIVTRLKNKVANSEPIVMACAGIGLIAKIADQAGVDILMGYNTGPFRMDGHGSLSGYLAYGDSNGITLTLGEHLLKVVDNTPVIGGIGAADPYRDIDMLIDKMIAMGFSGITNVPTAGLYDGVFRAQIDGTKLGYPEEIKLIEKCSRKDIFTVAYVFSEDEARAMSAAGADIIGAHVGLTIGGTIGAPKALTLDEACKKIQNMCDAAKKVNPDVLVVSHGGPFEDVESVRVCFEKTSVDGYLGASSMERLPVEKAITETIRAFQALRLK